MESPLSLARRKKVTYVSFIMNWTYLKSPLSWKRHTKVTVIYFIMNQTQWCNQSLLSCELDTLRYPESLFSWFGFNDVFFIMYRTRWGNRRVISHELDSTKLQESLLSWPRRNEVTVVSFVFSAQIFLFYILC